MLVTIRNTVSWDMMIAAGRNLLQFETTFRVKLQRSR